MSAWRDGMIRAAVNRRQVMLADGTVGTLTAWPSGRGTRATVASAGRHLHPLTRDVIGCVCAEPGCDGIAQPGSRLCRPCERAADAEARAWDEGRVS